MSRFPYSKAQGMAEKPGILPFIPLTLYYVGDDPYVANRLTVPALVDSGATVNVLPRDIGERFGLDWHEQRDILKPAGTIYERAAFVLPLWAKVPGIKPQQLLFAWSEFSSERIRVLLGQTNFFDEFYVDFRKPLGYFEITLKDE